MEINFNTVERARDLAKEKHQSQTDLAGKPYWLHVSAVAVRTSEFLIDGHRFGRKAFNKYRSGENSNASSIHFWDACVAVAYLHDVVEDTDISVEYIDAEFGSVIAEAVDAITKKPDENDHESYASYLLRLAMNPIAALVKIADLENNMEVHRFPEITDKTIERLRKYHKARNILTSSLDVPLDLESGLKVTGKWDS